MDESGGTGVEKRRRRIQNEENGQECPVFRAPAEPAAQATAEPSVAPEAGEQADVTDTADAEPTPTAALEVVKNTIYRQVGGTPLAEMEALYGENSDLVAWLNIPDVLDLPVVYRDNSYYLTHDFYGEQNTSGTIFLDVGHPYRERTQNLLLHGHNMKDGTMFGRLVQYERDISYLKNHPFITLSSLWNKEQYAIFAVLRVSLDTKSELYFNYYTHSTFSSDEEFTSYIRQLQLRSIYAIPMDVQPSDALLTLSTCLDDDRLVIVARRLRDGETRTNLRQIEQLAVFQ